MFQITLNPRKSNSGNNGQGACYSLQYLHKGLEMLFDPLYVSRTDIEMALFKRATKIMILSLEGMLVVWESPRQRMHKHCMLSCKHDTHIAEQHLWCKVHLSKSSQNYALMPQGKRDVKHSLLIGRSLPWIWNT
jgi:hypothetical protein